jgi:hypothetical protein
MPLRDKEFMPLTQSIAAGFKELMKIEEPRSKLGGMRSLFRFIFF